MKEYSFLPFAVQTEFNGHVLSCQSTLPRAFRIRSAGQPDINYIKNYTVSLTNQTEPICSCPTITSAFFSPLTAWSKTYSQGLTKHSHAR